jgi:cholest-4-en-3-one 26-monooxygenase
MWLPSASRDPRAIERPDVFDVTRGAKRCPHQAFGGGGRHFCLGAGLARMELTVFFEELLARTEEIRLVGDAVRIRSCFVDGYVRAPLELVPARRPAAAAA